MKEKKDKFYPEYVESLPSLEKVKVAITGTTTGTGYWTAVAAIRKNAERVFLLNRVSERATNSLAKLKTEAERVQSNTELVPIECDLMSFDSVRKAAETVTAQCASGLNVLVNNAGIMAFPDKRTGDGFDLQMQVNHLSHFLLTQLLLPVLVKASENGEDVRIVQHSSGARAMFGNTLEKKYYQKLPEGELGGHGIYQCFYRYHETKLSNTVFAMKLQKVLESKGESYSKIKSVVAEPGFSTTDLAANLRSAHESSGTLYPLTRFVAFMSSAISDWKLVSTQSSADGALPLIKVSFDNDIDSGDFYAPEHQMHGKPVKLIAKGVPIKGKESGTMNEKNQEILWTASEEAIGAKL